MGTIPVLKPKEVVAILKKLGFMKPDKEAPINNIAMLMGEELRYHFTLEEISHLYY